jgi:uncharacterized protein (TIGR03435 family)
MGRIAMRVILSVAAAVIVLAPTGRAQSPEFDVASIKVNRTESSSFSFRNGEVAATGVSLLGLLRTAYGLGTSRIVGPGWLDSDRYDVLAKSQAGASESNLRLMLQNLLKDRFRMSLHWEKREMPVYEMVVAKDGLKIKPFDPAQPMSEMKPTPGAVSMMGLASMTSLAETISGSAGRPVIDKTGLHGQYNYRLNFISLSTQSENAADPAPDFFAAIEQQLGLKLEPKRAQVEVLVIDHAERVPLEN